MEKEKDYWRSRRSITGGVGEGSQVQLEKNYLMSRKRNTGLVRVRCQITGAVGEGLQPVQ